jgi:hypothetical protein
VNSSALCRGEILPGSAGAPHLVHAAFVRMEKVIAIGDAVCACGTHRAFRPADRAHASAVLLDIRRDMNAIANAILNAGGLRRYQPSLPLNFPGSHTP